MPDKTPYRTPYIEIQPPYVLPLTKTMIELTLETAPIVFYPLNEPSGSVANDLSGNGYNATYTNVNVGAETFVDGTPSSIWNVGATVDSYVDISDTGYRDSLNASAGTFSVWVKSNEWNPTYGAIFEAPFSPTWTFRKDSDASHLNLQINGNSYNYDHQDRLDWFHICCTWDIVGDIQRYYIDGVEIATDTGLNDMSNFTTSSQQKIGHYSNSYHWDGGIRNFGIWDKVLTPDEITDKLITPAYM